MFCKLFLHFFFLYPYFNISKVREVIAIVIQENASLQVSLTWTSALRRPQVRVPRQDAFEWWKHWLLIQRRVFGTYSLIQLSSYPSIIDWEGYGEFIVRIMFLIDILMSFLVIVILWTCVIPCSFIFSSISASDTYRRSDSD